MKQEILKILAISLFLGFFCSGVYFSYASETIRKPLFATIIKPHQNNSVVIHPEGNAHNGEDEYFEIEGVAQPNTEINLYAMAIIPGTDGRGYHDTIKNPLHSDVAITKFSAKMIEDSSSRILRFSWRPRDIFHKPLIMENYRYIPNTCNHLKVKKSTDASNIPVVDPYLHPVPSLKQCYFVSQDIPSECYTDACTENCSGKIRDLPPCKEKKEVCNDIPDPIYENISKGRIPKCFFDKKPAKKITPMGEEAPAFLIFDEIVDPENKNDTFSLEEPEDKTAAELQCSSNDCTVHKEIWRRCSPEYKDCPFHGTREVRYGNHNTWVTQVKTNGVFCSPQNFGNPSFNQPEQCDILIQEDCPSREKWQFCSPETEESDLKNCRFTGKKLVRYGKGDVWIEEEHVGPISCHDSTFSQSTSGEKKECWYKTFVPCEDEAAWEKCAMENGQCLFEEKKTVRYGKNDAWVYKDFVDGVHCSNRIFQSPLFSDVYRCEYKDVIAFPKPGFYSSTDFKADVLNSTVFHYHPSVSCMPSPISSVDRALAPDAFPVGWIYKNGPFPVSGADGHELHTVKKGEKGAHSFLSSQRCMNSEFFHRALQCDIFFPKYDGEDSFSHFLEEKDFCDSYSDSLAMDCLLECNTEFDPFYLDPNNPVEAERYVIEKGCGQFTECIRKCREKSIQEIPKKYADGIEITRILSPITSHGEEEIWNQIKIKNGTGHILNFSEAELFDHFTHAFHKDIAVLGAEKPQIRVYDPNGCQSGKEPCQNVVCSHDLHTIRCHGYIDQDAELYIDYKIIPQGSGVGERTTTFKGRIVTNSFRIDSYDFGRFTIDIRFPKRESRIFDFTDGADENGEQTLPNYKNNMLVAIDLKNDTDLSLEGLELTLEFDPECLTLPFLRGEGDPIFERTVGKWERHEGLGWIRFTGAKGITYQELQGAVKFFFGTTKKSCKDTPIKATVAHKELGHNLGHDVVATQYITIKEDALVPFPLLDKDGENVKYHYFYPHFDNSNKGPEVRSDVLPSSEYWANNIIPPGKDYRPNTNVSSYSSYYLFQYSNYLECKGAGGESANAFMPIKEKFLLVDGFVQYELYGVPPDDYAAQEGVTRENGVLLAVLTDPSATSLPDSEEGNPVYVDLPFEDISEIYGTPDLSGWHFAIFEVRENNGPLLPKEITESTLEKQIHDTFAANGHLISSAHEVFVDDLGNISRPPSPPKIQWEIFEKDGGYFMDRIATNADGDIRLWSEGKEQPIRILKKRLNRFAIFHYFSGIYYSTDTRFSNDNQGNFYIGSNRSAARPFNINERGDGLSIFMPEINVYGTIYDEWTTDVVKDAKIHLSGKQFIGNLNESVVISAETSSDGTYSFLVNRGQEYSFQIQSIASRSDSFSLPEICTITPPFQNPYCSGEIFDIGGNRIHQDIPVIPNIRGEITNANGKNFIITLGYEGLEIMKTFSVPAQGRAARFSFFAPPGDYQILRIENDGASHNFQMNTSASLSIPDNREEVFSITLL